MANIPANLKVGDQTVFFTTSEDLNFLPANSVDLVLTSPPYWNLKNYGSHDEIGQEDYETYLSRLTNVWNECYRVAKDDAVLVVNIGNRRHQKVFYPIAMDIRERIEGWKLWDVLIWYIPNALPQPNHYKDRLFDNKHEYLLVFTKDGSTNYQFDKPRVRQKYAKKDPREHKKDPRGRCLGNVIRIPAYRPPTVKSLGYHVAAYPEELAALIISTFSLPGQTVLDPFVGSGTTLKVAAGYGRRGVGIELNHSFEELISKRLRENFDIPNWEDIDIIHSASSDSSRSTARRTTQDKSIKDQEMLFKDS